MGKTKSRLKEEYPVFGFNFEKVKAHVDNIKKQEEKIIYLEYVKKEKAINNDGLLELYMGLTFEQKIDKEIKFLRKKLKLQNPYMAEGYDKIVWSRNKQDFAPLFDLFMQLGFITFRRNKWEMLCNHFTWNDGEMTPKQLKDALSNINHNPETHRVSDEINELMKVIKNMKSS